MIDRLGPVAVRMPVRGGHCVVLKQTLRKPLSPKHVTVVVHAPIMQQYFRSHDVTLHGIGHLEPGVIVERKISGMQRRLIFFKSSVYMPTVVVF